MLEGIPVLQGMDDYHRSKLAETLTRRDYRQGDVVLRQGEQGDSFFLVEVGQLVAYRQDAAGHRAEEMPYGVGGYFGELALLEDRPRQATVECLTDCRLLEADRQSFKRMLGAEVLELLERSKAVYGRPG